MCREADKRLQPQMERGTSHGPVQWPMGEIACMTIKKEVILHYKKFTNNLERGYTVLQDCWHMVQIPHNCDAIM